MENTINSYLSGSKIDDLALFITTAREAGSRLSKITTQLHNSNLQLNVINKNK